MENEGKAEGRGVLSADGARLEFRLADFSGHASKLELLKRLMDRDDSSIDWHEFFADGFEEYADYIHARLNPEQKILESPIKSKGDNPFRPGGCLPKEEDESIEALDPFSGASRSETVASSEIIDMRNTSHHIDKLDFGRIPSGTLASHPIYSESDLCSDPGIAARALALMRRELA